MTLPPEKINQIKQIIHSRFSELDIQSKIRDIIADKLSESGEQQATHASSQELLIQELKKKGIVDSIINGLKIDSNNEEKNHFNSKQPKKTVIVKSNENKIQEFLVPLNQTNIDPNRRHLYLQIIAGKAFLEYINVDDALPGISQPYFTLYIHFRNQRFKSKQFSCVCEPRINEGFLIELHKEKHDKKIPQMADRETLLSICDHIHLVLIQTDSNGDSNLVSSHFLDWRSVISSNNNKQNVTVELMGTGSESKVPVGLLNICIQLLPMLDEPVREDILAAQMGLEHSKNTERERLFLLYAKQWWKEYLEIRDDHKNRLVKIFAQDENGTNRPVCSFIRPIKVSRLLDTPRQAARFVSLIGYNKLSSSIGVNEQVEQWLNMHTFLVRNCGDSENHAILLCSLLIGFGLDAYVCIGTKQKSQPHAWVVTISANYEDIVFWESLTGNRYIHKYINPDDPPLDKQMLIKHPYKTVGCVFNHKSFFANIQPTNNVDTCSFMLKEQNKWKALSEESLSTICSPSLVSSIPFSPNLTKNQLDDINASNDLERQLRALTVEHRKDFNLLTQWDDHLSYVLNQALASYESERVTGFSVGNEEFDQAIKLAIPDGHSFKAFPIQFIHRTARKIFLACLKSPICEEIISCRGDQVKLALRVRIFAYPESAIAVWVMFACRYKLVV
jgi:centrosomal protein CEP76